MDSNFQQRRFIALCIEVFHGFHAVAVHSRSRHWQEQIKSRKEKEMMFADKIQQHAKKMLRSRILLGGISATFLVLFILSLAHAGEGLQMAPRNPQFQKYMEALNRGEVKLFSEDGHPLGYVPGPFDRSHLNRSRFDAQNAAQGDLREAVGAPPATYDLRTLGRVTPVGDQGWCGSCWAFGVYSGLESWLKKQGQTWDLAEADMNDYHGFDIPSCEGGDDNMATAYLARWSGPVMETDYPYPYGWTAPGVPVVKYLKDVRWIPRSGALDNDEIKNAVISTGAVTVSFWYTSSAWNAGTNSYYYSGAEEGTNHCVAIVGWDDNYAKSKFATTPPGNGAFIIKNSWGTGWGDNGYFYMSYYDQNLGYATSYYNAVATSTFRRNYQYDPLGLDNSVGCGSDTLWAANIFVASSSAPRIKAVSTYALTDKVAYTLEIRKNVPADQPRGGTLVLTKTGTIAKAGYHTITLTTPATVTAGKRFSVVLKLKTPGYNWPLPAEFMFYGYTSAASSTPGQSFVSCDGNDWTSGILGGDLYYLFPGYFPNACIKAFGIAPPT